jgi:hypothetical protein
MDIYPGIYPLIGDAKEWVVSLGINVSPYTDARNIELRDVWMVINDLQNQYDFVFEKPSLSLLQPWETVIAIGAMTWFFEVWNKGPITPASRPIAKIGFSFFSDLHTCELHDGDLLIFEDFARRLSMLCKACIFNKDISVTPQIYSPHGDIA